MGDDGEARSPLDLRIASLYREDMPRPRLWPVVAALATVAGCATRHDSHDASLPPSPEAAVRPTAALPASPPAVPTPEPGTGETAGPTYRLAVAGSLLLVRGPHGGTTPLELVAEATLDGRDWTSQELAWRRDGNALVAKTSAPTADWRIEVAADPSWPRLVLRVDVRYTARTTVEREAIVLGIGRATAPRVLDRDFVLRPVSPGTRRVTDPWTPLEVRAETPAGPVTLVRAGGFPSASTEAADDRLAVRLELDDAGNHPFRPYDACHRRHAEGRPRRTLDAAPRRERESVRHAAELWLGETILLRPARFPAGQRAAVVLTSHADQATAARTRAVLWGHSDPEDESYGRRGLLGRGLSATLTAFAERGVHDDLADPDYAQVLAEAAAAGVEVAPHSVTAGPDDRATLDRLLPAFDPFRPVTWIDHQPDTNCEAVMSGPALPGLGSSYELAGALRARGYRYVWTEPDVDPPDGGLNLLAPRRPDRRPVVLFRNLHYRHGEWVPWMFRTAWFFVDRETLAERLAPAALRRLADERGVLIAHVYLDAYEPRGLRADRSLLEPQGRHFRLRDEADAVFRALAEAQAAGRLWVPPLRALADHWTAAAEVRVAPQPDGGVILCAGARDVPAMTWIVPRGGANVRIDGGAPDGTDSEGDETAFWIDLPAGAERKVVVTIDGAPLPLYPAGRVVLEGP